MADGTLKVGTITTSSGSGTITIGQSGETVDMSNATQTGVGGTNTAEFLAYRGGSTQTGIADNVTTKLEFNTESFDPDGVFDNSTNYRFVAPSAGKYMLYTNIHIYDSSTSIQTFTLKFYKNGSKYSQTYFLSSSDDPVKYAFLSLTQVADLSASDYIEVYAQVNTVDGGSTNLEHESGIMQNYFGGYKLIT